MTKVTASIRLSALLILIAAIGACGTSQKEPAKNALNEAESIIRSIDPDEAERYLPGRLTDIKSSLAVLQAAFDKQDYDVVIADAPALNAKSAEFVDALSTAKRLAEAELERLNSQWKTSSSKLSGMLNSISTTLANPPKSVERTAIEFAGLKITELQTRLASATSDFNAGKVAEALEKTQTIESEASTLMMSIGFTE
jgi:hypothetical protein